MKTSTAAKIVHTSPIRSLVYHFYYFKEEEEIHTLANKVIENAMHVSSKHFLDADFNLNSTLYIQLTHVKEVLLQ